MLPTGENSLEHVHRNDCNLLENATSEVTDDTRLVHIDLSLQHDQYVRLNVGASSDIL
jgi:hypothetical protein